MIIGASLYDVYVIYIWGSKHLTLYKVIHAMFLEQSDLVRFEGDLDSLCHTCGFAGYFECSAKKFECIDKAVKAMVKKVR